MRSWTEQKIPSASGSIAPSCKRATHLMVSLLTLFMSARERFTASARGTQ